MKTMIVLLAIFALGAFAAVERVSFDQLDSKVQLAARNHIAFARNLVDNGAWENAELLSAIPLYKDDMAEPAYYEVQVTSNGAPAGVLHVATGEHDHPVTFFTEHGSSAFSEEALSGDRIVLRDRQLLGKSNPSTLTARDRKDITRSWKKFSALSFPNPTSEPGDLSGKVCVPMPNNDPSFPRFDQYKDGSGCYSGCGPTALAMLYTWGAALGAAGNLPWKTCFSGAEIPTGGYSSSPGVEAMTRQIGSEVGTFCVPFSGGNSATPPSNPLGKDMSSGNYLGEHGSTAKLISDGSVLGRRVYAGDAIAGIVSGSAAIIGIGSYPADAHYVLVSCHGTSGGQNWWRANMGWGGSSNGWLPMDPWYAGYLKC